MQLVIAGAGLLVVGVGVAWDHAHAVRVAETALADVVRKRSGCAEDILRLQSKLADADETRSAAERELSGVGSKAVPAARPSLATPRVERGPSIAERLRDEPDTQLFWLASKRSESSSKYRALFGKLGLAPEQIDRFQDLLIKRDEQVMDVTAIMRAEGLAKPDAAISKLFAQSESDLRTAQRELLGDAGFAQLREYERTASLLNLVNGVAGGAVVVARDPLSAQQAEHFLQVMANTSASFQRGGVAIPTEIDWDTVGAHARTFLSPAQFNLFASMEPPLPTGARFQSQLYQQVDKARKLDSAAAPIPSPDSGR